MYPVSESPSPTVLFAIIFLISIAFPFWKKRSDTVELAVFSAFVAAVIYTIFESIVDGFSPLFAIGFGLTMIFYLPISFFLTFVVRFLQRRMARQRNDRTS